MVNGLDNGLARTPPMGWLHWERFRCLTNCTEYPGECINDQLFREMADEMISGGYLDAGYEYLIIDDCWLANSRDSQGRLQPDPDRFPNGISGLADYVHSLGLKFGIYEDYGTLTCAGYPGSQGYERIDAQTFASWGVDYLKLDGCNSDPAVQENGTAEFARQLNLTGRPILFSCEYPLYEYQINITTNYTRAGQISNLWRNFHDIQDSWSTVLRTIEYFKANQDIFQPAAGPGRWNDPDMLVIGNYGLSRAQSEAQMALWSILASPLLMSTDLRTISSENRAILLNRLAIQINQDSMGIQGRFIRELDQIDVYTRPITPIKNGDSSYAVAFLSRRDDGNPMVRRIVLRDIGLNHTAGYDVQDVFNSRAKTFRLRPDQLLEVRVVPTGVVFLQLTAL